jgi:hypothetical protein
MALISQKRECQHQMLQNQSIFPQPVQPSLKQDRIFPQPVKEDGAKEMGRFGEIEEDGSFQINYLPRGATFWR